MNNETISRLDLIKRFEKATKTQKAALTEILGEDFFKIDITDKVKSFEDACEVLGMPASLPDMSVFPEEYRETMLARYQIIIITEALNEGWKPDWDDKYQEKWFPWFGAAVGFACAYSHSAPSAAYSSVGSRLCLKNKRLSDYSGTQFIKIHRRHLLG